MRVGRREAAGSRGASSVQERVLDCRLGAGHGEERTSNMRAMVVTLEVSKLSGWLNAAAPWIMAPMFVTLEVSKLSGWLNGELCRE